MKPEVAYADGGVLAGSSRSRRCGWCASGAFLWRRRPEILTCMRTCSGSGSSSLRTTRWRRSLVSGRMKAAEAEIERLRREVQKLKAERDILKKAAAYFAKDQT